MPIELDGERFLRAVQRLVLGARGVGSSCRPPLHTRCTWTPLSGVNLLVFDKTVVLAEGLATLVAFVGLLAGVDALIHYEG